MNDIGAKRTYCSIDSHVIEFELSDELESLLSVVLLSVTFHQNTEGVWLDVVSVHVGYRHDDVVYLQLPDSPDLLAGKPSAANKAKCRLALTKMFTDKHVANNTPCACHRQPFYGLFKIQKIT